MFKQVLAVLTIGLTILCNAQAQKGPEHTVVVSRGTVLKLSTVQPLDSATARPGDDIPLRLSRPLVVNGVTLLREGDVLHGRVTRVKHGGKHCRSGLVAWKIDHVAFEDHTTTQSMMYYPPPNLEVPEHTEITGMNSLRGGRRIGFYALTGTFFLTALPFMTGHALLFSAPPFSHSSDNAHCTAPQEFQLPPGTRVAVVITKEHHVRF
jgi:hypothetical protein